MSLNVHPWKDDNKVAIQLDAKWGAPRKPCERNSRPLYGSVDGQCGEQKAAGIDAMVYIYRLKCPSFPPTSSTISLSISSVSSSHPVSLSVQPSAFLPGLWRWKKQEKRIGHSVWSRAIVIFSQILPFPSKFHHPSGQTIKKKKKGTRLSARGFPYNCIREIVTYGCRYCAAG